MKSLVCILAGLVLATSTTAVFAEAPKAPVFTHDKAVEAATYLARQKVFAAQCPFSDAVKASLARLETVIVPVLGLAHAELESVSKTATASALELITEPKLKSMTCPILEAALRRQTEPEPKRLTEPLTK